MSKTYCSLPFIHLATHPHGGVTLCCVSDHTEGRNRARNFTEDGNADMLELNSSSTVQILNSDYYKQTRLKMLNNEVPPACQRCFKEEADGVRSKRIEENERLQFTEDMARAITTVDGTLTTVDFKFIELRLGNLCNIKCRTCNPASSTSWGTEYQKLQQEVTFVTKYDKSINCNWTESDVFWEDLLHHSNGLQLLYVNGGEPTLVEKHWKYLERLIDAGLNKQITLWYNINMTHVPDKLLDLWSQFKAVQVTCSVDDLGERNAYIRTGTKWETVLENLDKLQKNTWIKLSVCQTISWLNAYYLPEFHDFMKERNIHVHMNYVYDPEFLSLQVLPTRLGKIILARCEGRLDEWQLNSLKSQINGGSLFAFSKGLTYNGWLDKSRNTSFNDTFPEWAKTIMKELKHHD